MKITDGKKTVNVEIRCWTGNGYSPDWSNDYFEAGRMDYDAEADAYKVADVDYCIDFAGDRDNPESAVYGDPDAVVFVDDLT